MPGNFELALYDSGLIDDPFFGHNVLKLQEFESYHTWYCLQFDVQGVDGSETLLFEGLDTFARIYLNGEIIGETDNMLIPHEIPAISLKEGANELVVHIRPATIEARKFEMEAGAFALRYNYDSLYVRGAPTPTVGTSCRVSSPRAFGARCTYYKSRPTASWMPTFTRFRSTKAQREPASHSFTISLFRRTA